jgi:hypothetical protein
MDDRQARENVLAAVGLMTAWLEFGEGEPRPSLVDKLLLERAHDPMSMMRLTSGLVGLAGETSRQPPHRDESEPPGSATGDRD